MSAKKKTISRVLSLVLIVALIVPALLVIPVLAESSTMIYNGVELPTIPLYNENQASFLSFRETGEVDLYICFTTSGDSDLVLSERYDSIYKVNKIPGMCSI